MKNIFGTDGIRGVANEGMLSVESLTHIVPAVIDKFFPKRILIAKDTRISGDLLMYSTAAILNSYGINVTLIGVAPTPAVSYLTRMCGFDLGVAISASHNPYQDNGIKIFNKNGTKLSTQDEEKISDIINRAKVTPATHGEIGITTIDEGLLTKYVEFITSHFEKIPNMRIVVDCANGAFSHIAKDIFSKFSNEIIYVACEPNGININDNCGVMYPNNLSKEVRKHQADIGIAFDGDGDRVLICDEKGDVVDGDHLLGFLAVKLADINSVAVTQTSNMALDDFLSTAEIKVVRTDVGDKHIADEIQKGNASFGGEKSGHIIINSDLKTGDGLFVALSVLTLLPDNTPISNSLRLFDLYPSVHKNIKVKDKGVIDSPHMQNFLRQLSEDKAYRILVRKSGTEKVIRVIVEGEEQELANEIASLIEREILLNE